MDKDNNTSNEFYNYVLSLGFDAINSRGGNGAQVKSETALLYYMKRFIQKVLHVDIVLRIKYSKIIKNYYIKDDSMEQVYPTIIPNFDRSPRAGKKTNNIWYGSTPELFGEMVREALDLIKDKQDEHKILFLQSWNEWGEGNYMEPDLKFGHGYIEVLCNLIK